MTKSLELLTDAQGRFRFAVVAAPMLCGFDARLEDIHEFYRQLRAERVRHAFVLGPVIDVREMRGDSRGSMRGQYARFFADNWPRQPGIQTYYLKSSGPIRTEPAMKAAGRDDWTDLPGHWLRVRRVNTPASLPLILVHLMAADFDHRRRQLRRALDVDHVVAVFSGRRQPDVTWEGGGMVVSPGLFHGSAELVEPVGGGIVEFVLTHAGAVEDSSFDFWDWNGTDLRRIETGGEDVSNSIEYGAVAVAL